jgi:NAD(P)-dependent dehydrogenase (short-subunit alcohol dehydrogenase family)
MKTNRVVVITGAAGGMGSVLVHRFLMNGDTVIATDIKSAALEELRERHNAHVLITRVGDISKEKDCATLAESKLRALKRDEQPEDLVGAVFFLASPDADFITGQIINVDGGKVKH